MSTRSRQVRASRERLAGPGALVALLGTALGGLWVLHLASRGARLPGPGADALTLPYLRALVDRYPGDQEERLRLAREELAVGRFGDGAQTLAPLLARGAEAPAEAIRLEYEIAAAAWRAAPAGSRERESAGASLATLLSRPRGAMAADLARLAGLALEMGRPDLAGRAAERAAALEPEGCARWLAAAARDYVAAGDGVRGAATYARASGCAGDPEIAAGLGLEALAAYQAAEVGDEALRCARDLARRFPSDRAVLERAVGVALAQDAPADAMRFGARLVDASAADAASLRGQLDRALAAGDLGEALRAATRWVRAAPGDERPRLAAATVATWAGQRDLALRHWSWLARRSGAAGAVEEALRLARALGEGVTVAELLALQSRTRPLSPASLAELADALARSGPPGSAAAALADETRRHPGSVAAWEELAAVQERAGDLSGALSTRGEIARRFGSSLPASLRAARLQRALGRPADALAELRRWVDLARTEDVDYWGLAAEVAWEEQAGDVASRAYGELWQSGSIDALGAERLLLLARAAGRPDDVIRRGREGWYRFRRPRLLVLAMDEAARAGRWDDLARLVKDGAGEASALARDPAYWLLRARLDASRGRVRRAVEDYRQALAVEPGSAAARSALLWLLIRAGDRDGLSRCLAEWAGDAASEPELWRAYAVGLEQLGRAPEALPFYERAASADPRDEEAAERYARALARARDRSQAREGGGAAAAARAPITVGAELAIETFGALSLRRERVRATSDAIGVPVEIVGERTGFSSSDASLPGVAEETGVLARATLASLGGTTEVAGALRLRPDRDVLQASLAHARDLSSFAWGRLEAALNEPADESAILRALALRRRVGGTLTLTAGRLYASAGADWKSWSARTGAALARGGAAVLELGVKARIARPEVRVSFQGGHQRNGLIAGPGAAVLPDGILPRQLSTIGVGAAAARWPVGPALLAADAWAGLLSPPVRPAFRARAGVALALFGGAELSLSAFVANDRFGSYRGASASVAYRFGS